MEKMCMLTVEETNEAIDEGIEKWKKIYPHGLEEEILWKYQ